MRISCEIKVSSRLLPSLAMAPPAKAQRASVAVGHKSDATDETKQVYILVCTVKNRGGMNYKGGTNIEQIFSNFVQEGRATVRFKEPPHDLLIQNADPIQLKGFVQILRLSLEGKTTEKMMSLSTLVPASRKQVECPKKRLNITKRKDYPVSIGFPPEVEVLNVTGCQLGRLDRRMLTLKHLQEIDLSDNCIKELPVELGSLSLVTVNFSRNQLKELPATLFCGQWLQSLRVLKLVNNQLEILPPTICRLRSLTILNVCENSLSQLPSQIGRLSRLRELAVNGNNISTLPASITRLQLESVHLMDNPLLEQESCVIKDNLKCPSLLDLAAGTVVKHKISYSEEDITPNLTSYLRSGHQCRCGRLCWETHVLAAIKVDLLRLAHTISAPSNLVPVQSYLCSNSCLQRFINNPFA